MHFHLRWHGIGLRSLIHLYIAYKGISITIMTCSAEESPFVCCASKQVIITSKSTKKVVRVHYQKELSRASRCRRSPETLRKSMLRRCKSTLNALNAIRGHAVADSVGPCR